MALLYKRVLSATHHAIESHNIAIPHTTASCGHGFTRIHLDPLASSIRNVKNHSITSASQLATLQELGDVRWLRDGWSSTLPRSAKAIFTWREESVDACTASFAPSSTFRNPARIEQALAAWCYQQTARAGLFSRRHCKLCLSVLAMPVSSCMHMPPRPPDPMPSSTPWGHEGGEQEWSVSYIQ